MNKMTGLQKLKVWMDDEVYAPTYADIVNKIKDLLREETLNLNENKTATKSDVKLYYSNDCGDANEY